MANKSRDFSRRLGPKNVVSCILYIQHYQPIYGRDILRCKAIVDRGVYYVIVISISCSVCTSCLSPYRNDRALSPANEIRSSRLSRQGPRFSILHCARRRIRNPWSRGCSNCCYLRMVSELRPSPSLKRNANGRLPWPGLKYAVYFLSPGQGVRPLSPV